jgi:hypothetical protein
MDKDTQQQLINELRKDRDRLKEVVFDAVRLAYWTQEFLEGRPFTTSSDVPVTKDRVCGWLGGFICSNDDGTFDTIDEGKANG